VKGLVLAGGHGTRLRPLTYSGNKHMLPIANQPILFYGLRHLARAGIRDVAIVLGPINEGIQESVGDGREFGLNVEYVQQGEPKGLAHAVLCAREFLSEDPFVMYLGDNLLQQGVVPFVNRYSETHSDAVVGATPVPDPRAFGVVELSGDRIVSIEEKPAVPKSNLALIGVYLFSPAIHPIIRDLTPSKRGELEITDAIWRLWKSNGKVTVLRLDGWWKDTGHPGDLLEANELVLGNMPAGELQNEGYLASGAVVEGRVGIGARTVIASTARLVGPTIIGVDAHIGPDAVVGPFAAIGNRATVAHSLVHRSIVMDGARIEGVSLVNSLVGRGAEIVATVPLIAPLTLTLGDSSRVTL
jgi:glucose-1-phosphate thymidylyltransferase